MNSFHNGRVEVWEGDCRDVLAGFEADTFDSVVTDPPYGLQFMGREWDKLWRNQTDADQAYVDRTAGQLTSRARKLPDYSGMARGEQMEDFHRQWAEQVFRVLKPGAHLVAFSSPRTCHRMACAIEDAGFEVRDSLLWLFGSGFPKSHNVSKSIDKLNGGMGTYGDFKSAEHNRTWNNTGNEGWQRPWKEDAAANDRYSREYLPADEMAQQFKGWGTALKPAYEPIILARKPLIGTIAANVMSHSTGALNIDACRVAYEATANPATNPLYRKQNGYKHAGNDDSGSNSFTVKGQGEPSIANPSGRWPANVILSWPEDEYQLRRDITPEQKRQVFGWLSENA